MERVVNGTEVIETGLNSCIIATTESANSIDFAIKIDFLKLFGRKTKRQCCVMEEILDLSSNFDSARELIKHPVIAAFIWAKWEKSKKYYYLHALIYMAFLLFYSVIRNSIEETKKYGRTGKKLTLLYISYPLKHTYSNRYLTGS